MPVRTPGMKRITPALSAQGNDAATSPQLTDAASARVTGEPRPLPALAPQRLDAVQAAESKLPVNMRPYDQQIDRLRRQVEDLQQRLALAEKRLAEHRHTYSAPRVNQLNYRTVRGLLDNSGQRDGLLNFPGMPVQQETGLPVVPQ